MRLLQAALLVALLCCGAATQAHNYHAGLTDISFNPNTGSTELVHTYTAHDVEALLMNLYQRHVDLGLEEDQAMFRRYLEKQFRIAVDGKPLALQWVGMEARSDRIVIYQELPGQRLPAGALLQDGVLADFVAEQVNTVNVGGFGRPAQTLTFTRARREQALP